MHFFVLAVDFLDNPCFACRSCAGIEPERVAGHHHAVPGEGNQIQRNQRPGGNADENDTTHAKSTSSKSEMFPISLASGSRPGNTPMKF